MNKLILSLVLGSCLSGCAILEKLNLGSDSSCPKEFNEYVDYIQANWSTGNAIDVIIMNKEALEAMDSCLLKRKFFTAIVCTDPNDPRCTVEPGHICEGDNCTYLQHLQDVPNVDLLLDKSLNKK